MFAAMVDFDDNGNIGLGDFSLFTAAYGSTDLLYDLDQNGNVGLGDFSIFTAWYGSQVPGGEMGETVPEPVTLALLGIGAATLCRRRRAR